MADTGLSVLDGYVRRQALASDIREYLPLLNGFVRVYPQARVLEIGTREGNSTLALLAGAQAVGGHVWSVDMNAQVPDNPNGMGPFRDSRSWSFTAGNSIDPAVADLQPLEVDVLFIDSGHEYDLTLAELGMYAPRVVGGGVVLLHDTLMSYDDHGVRRALNVYCAQANLTWHNLPGQYGMGLIVK